MFILPVGIHENTACLYNYYPVVRNRDEMRTGLFPLSLARTLTPNPSP